MRMAPERTKEGKRNAETQRTQRRERRRTKELGWADEDGSQPCSCEGLA